MGTLVLDSVFVTADAVLENGVKVTVALNGVTGRFVDTTAGVTAPKLKYCAVSSTYSVNTGCWDRYAAQSAALFALLEAAGGGGNTGHGARASLEAEQTCPLLGTHARPLASPVAGYCSSCRGVKFVLGLGLVEHVKTVSRPRDMDAQVL